MRKGEFTKDTTRSEKYEPAMRIKTAKAAAVHFEKCVRHCMTFGKTRKEAERIERSNLGYYAGYFDDKVRARVERLFLCAHPVFGAIAEKGPPSLEEALQLGVRMGKKMRKGGANGR